MKQLYFFGFWAAAGLLAPVGPALAQLTITAVSPAANARAARPGPVVATFSEPLTAASAGALKVYSAQRGGLRTRGATPAEVSGNTLSFAPRAYPFMPGETVFSTVTAAAAGNSGHLAHARVAQFTAAVGGTGRGTFPPGPDVATGSYPRALALGDVDGDGDLDLLIANGFGASGTVSELLNGGDATGSNTGVFVLNDALTIGPGAHGVALGDVDGDGDLDLVSSNTGNQLVVLLNGGDATGSNTGQFINGSTATVEYPGAPVLGDVDGDGDLDLVATSGSPASVRVRLNGGDATGSNTGRFSNGTALAAYTQLAGLAVGDVDGDGALDVVTANGTDNTASVYLNDGGGFSSASRQAVAVGSNPTAVLLGDVDGDGDLDLLTVNYGSTATPASGTASVRLNGGDATGSNTGVFGNGPDLGLGVSPAAAALGDVDGDGDLDLVATNYQDNTVSVRLNGGDATGSNTGVFGGGSVVAVGSHPGGVALGDVDGDGDLDLVATNFLGNTVSVRLNQPAQALAAGLKAPKTGFTVAPTVAAEGAPRYAYTGPGLEAGTELAIYSVTGQCVQQLRDVAAAGTLPTAGLASGWYVARLRTSGGSYVARFYRP
ncbi:FG-GAP-like repeat-containing protein [Hymenobacter caeli]|uniref:SbsA Ig-like domain-containing protein n=1 Tax=Hymenobacter caeli TaxID=2735894 RepID=A0ABX2FWU1_9BACT|nr:T9SS type A sorting domain-containing protein [Hymenobacter caeli]NRT21243.1 hypothetical protein [Hymenobacter caeli]